MIWVWLVPVIIGAVIFALGIGFVVWGSREEAGYYDNLISRTDLREFFSRWPPRAEPGALRVGGWIAIVVGLITAGIGVILYLTQK
jgi:uncharacterized membrane protein